MFEYSIYVGTYKVTNMIPKPHQKARDAMLTLETTTSRASSSGGGISALF